MFKQTTLAFKDFLRRLLHPPVKRKPSNTEKCYFTLLGILVVKAKNPGWKTIFITILFLTSVII